MASKNNTLYKVLDRLAEIQQVPQQGYNSARIMLDILPHNIPAPLFVVRESEISLNWDIQETLIFLTLIHGILILEVRAIGVEVVVYAVPFKGVFPEEFKVFFTGGVYRG